MGNPHCITPIADVDALKIEEIGPYFEHHPAFPDRVNTEFIRVLDRRTVQMRVWERGSGETWACGTGACAVAVACILNGWTEDEVTVKLRGGDLKICWDKEKNTVFMTGPATVVFDGEISLS
jgi:diaminopimelate epimerase